MSKKKNKKITSTKVSGVSSIRWIFGTAFILSILAILAIKITNAALNAPGGLDWNFMVAIDSINIGKPLMAEGVATWIYYLDQAANILMIVILPLSLIVWVITWFFKTSDKKDASVVNNITNITYHVSEAKLDQIIANENRAISLPEDKKEGQSDDKEIAKKNNTLITKEKAANDKAFEAAIRKEIFGKEEAKPAPKPVAKKAEEKPVAKKVEEKPVAKKVEEKPVAKKTVERQPQTPQQKQVKEAMEKALADTKKKPAAKKAKKVYPKVAKKEILETLNGTYEGEMSKKDIKAILDGLFEVMEANLFKVDSEINIAGFGKFVTVKKPKRTSINPATGEKINVPAHKAITFKAAKKLKETMN